MPLFRTPLVVVFLFALGLSAPGSNFRVEAGPPNVLFISIDDLNDWAGPFGGHASAVTPNLDRFCRDGAIVFQNAHCAGPVCCISRSALLSGFMPHRSGVYSNSQNMLDSELIKAHATLPEYFSQHGYRSISKGKIFHRHATARGSDSGHWAFDEWFPTTGGTPVDDRRVTSRNRNLINGKAGPKTEHTKSGGTEFAWGPTVGTIAETRDYQTALWAAEQLKTTHDKPLFLAVGLSKPHLPFYAPKEFFDPFDREGVKANPIREDDLADILTPRGKVKFAATADYRWLKQNGLIDEAARAYLAVNSYADACLGVIFDALQQSPMRDNTIVLVWGDHGWHLGEKMRYRKGSGWRESTRVPLIIRTPPMTRRQDSDGLVNLIDLFPTLIDFCGLPPKPEIDGRSFARLLDRPDATWNQPTVTIFGPGNASIQDDRWHYIRHRDGTEELYEYRRDPMEWKNLAASTDSEAAEAKSRLAPHYPDSFAPPIESADSAQSKRWKRQAKSVDPTIKPSRPLSELK